MSADISAARGVSAPETSEALWATDGLDLSTDESYAAGSMVAQLPATAGEMGAGHHNGRRLRGAPNGGTRPRILASGQICGDRYSTAFTITTTLAQRQPRWWWRCPLASNAAHATCERKLHMSINPDAAEGRTHVRSSAERALWRMAGPWWLFLLTGLAWLIIALVTLRFTTTSIATVGVLLGVLFLLAAFNEVMISAVKQSWRWAHILLGIFFVVGAIWAFARPFDAFWSIASVLGFLLVFKGTLDVISAFMTKDVNSSWWLGLVVGILEL